MTLASEATAGREIEELLSRSGPSGLAVPSVVHAFAIIDLLASTKGQLRLAGIVSGTGLPKTTVHRLLRTLTTMGITHWNNDGFSLGPTLARYANTPVSNHTEIIGLFYSVVGRVQKELRETVQLAVLTPPDITFVAFLDSDSVVRLVTRVGRRLPAHASASGKALLAFSQAETVREALDRPLTALTDWTITDRQLLLDQFKLTHTRGWAYESQESAANLSCVSVPILNSAGIAFATLTACLPVPFIAEPSQRQMASIMTGCANEMSRRISG